MFLEFLKTCISYRLFVDVDAEFFVKFVVSCNVLTHICAHGLWLNQCQHKFPLKHLPFFLETPNELEGYAKEIALLKQMNR